MTINHKISSFENYSRRHQKDDDDNVNGKKRSSSFKRHAMLFSNVLLVGCYVGMSLGGCNMVHIWRRPMMIEMTTRSMCGARAHRHPTLQKMTILRKFYALFVPGWYFCGVSVSHSDHSLWRLFIITTDFDKTIQTRRLLWFENNT